MSSVQGGHCSDSSQPNTDKLGEKVQHSSNAPGEAAQNVENPGGGNQQKEKSRGGYNPTPIQHQPPGYTIKITFHGASHLPMADLSDLSSDPYLYATLTTDLPARHKEDPPLRFRTRTLWRTCNPKWNEEWIIAHVPASGFRLKARIYDEDSRDKDDRLGNVHVDVAGIGEEWAGIHNQDYKIKIRSGSWRAYALRGLAVCFGKAEEMSGRLNLSIECLGKSEGKEGGRCYTTGLNYWCKHYSPFLGRIVHLRDPAVESPNGITEQQNTGEAENSGKQKAGRKRSRNRPVSPKPGHYNFQANQMQLQGPVPPQLYHRYVDFRPIVAAIFTSKGIRGLLLNKAFRHQHQQVYNFNRDTEYGVFKHPCKEMTCKFLELVHYDEGGRLFTYVLTLDGLLRFTETGKEFGIDLLSKHTMHSDASIFIAYSGEFFIRRLRQPYDPSSEHEHASRSNKHHSQEATSSNIEFEDTHPPKDIGGGPPSSPPPRDPSHYELVLDNASGTYRPNSDCLPYLRQFMQKNFPGLKIVTVDSLKDEELLEKLKKQQRERKRREGAHVVYTQNSGRSSVSSSDEERLNQLQEDFINSSGEGEAEEKKHKLGEAIAPYVGNHSHLRSGLTKHDHDKEKHLSKEVEKEEKVSSSNEKAMT